MNIEYTPNRSP